MTLYLDCDDSITNNNPQTYFPTRCVCQSVVGLYSGVSGFSFLVSSALLCKPIHGRQIQLHLIIAGVTKSDCAL